MVIGWELMGIHGTQGGPKTIRLLFSSDSWDVVEGWREVSARMRWKLKKNSSEVSRSRPIDGRITPTIQDSNSPN